MEMDGKLDFLGRAEERLGREITAAELPGALRALREILEEYEVSRREHLEPGSQDDLLQIYTAAMAVEGRSPKTVERYAYILRRLMTDTGTSAGRMTVHQIRGWLAREQARGIKDTTLEGDRQVFSAFFGWLQREGLIARNPVANLGAIKCARERKEAFNEVDIEKLKRACRNPRDLALMLFLLSTGCRISEVTELDRADVDLQGLTCVVRGKGNKERRVYLDRVAGMAMEEYLESRKDGEKALFIGKRMDRFTPSGARRMLKRLAAAAGVENVHPHRFRRTMATGLTRHGMPIQKVSRLLGHEKIDTTMRYVELNDEDVRSAYRRCVG